MTILAICGPIGSDFKAFSERCYSLLKAKSAILIDSSTHDSIESLIKSIDGEQDDIIVYGAKILLDVRLREKFDIMVFLETDDDLCFSSYLKSSKTDELNFEERSKYYFSEIKPDNEKIRLSARYAAVRLPQTSSGDKLIDILLAVDIETGSKTLRKIPTIPESQLKSMFWKLESQFQQADSNDNIAPVGSSNQIFK
ncbi:nucleoside/nucleotide kinase family protein [Legionella fallonii]|uniref:Putative Uridine kinase n=1 Tax=Legionella fallonii LLAP-10 TaxID=1212491 RepID=A0A098FZQ8_9GAMM|nr:hypothetical protein [Legionella fallonii]CEG55718.1 putative Uridine kinase [Legionella fallonii LLAP-10]